MKKPIFITLLVILGFAIVVYLFARAQTTKPVGTFSYEAFDNVMTEAPASNAINRRQPPTPLRIVNLDDLPARRVNTTAVSYSTYTPENLWVNFQETAPETGNTAMLPVSTPEAGINTFVKRLYAIGYDGRIQALTFQAFARPNTADVKFWEGDCPPAPSGFMVYGPVNSEPMRPYAFLAHEWREGYLANVTALVEVAKGKLPMGTPIKGLTYDDFTKRACQDEPTYTAYSAFITSSTWLFEDSTCLGYSETSFGKTVSRVTKKSARDPQLEVTTDSRSFVHKPGFQLNKSPLRFVGPWVSDLDGDDSPEIIVHSSSYLDGDFLFVEITPKGLQLLEHLVSTSEGLPCYGFRFADAFLRIRDSDKRGPPEAQQAP